LNELIEKFDASMTTPQLEKLHRQAQTVYNALNNQTDEETPKSREGIAIKRQLLQDCESIRQTLEDEIASRKG
jgi:hypothetical protein